MEALLGIIITLGGALLLLMLKNEKLESDKKLNDIAVADAKLETKQEIIKEQKAELQEELVKVEPAKDLSDKEIEDYWNKDKK
jgi:septal ring factor EnvC (AmiA/AmiB activator)